MYNYYNDVTNALLEALNEGDSVTYSYYKPDVTNALITDYFIITINFLLKIATAV